MLLAATPRVAAVVLGRSGFTASFGTTVAHDAGPGTLGPLRSFGAEGPVSLVGGNRTDVAGSAGGRFDVTAAGAEIRIAFDRSGLGTGFAEGDRTATEISVPVTDTDKVVNARIRVTVARPYRPPVLAQPVADQSDPVIPAPVLVQSLLDRVDPRLAPPVLVQPLPDRTTMM